MKKILPIILGLAVSSSIAADNLTPTILFENIYTGVAMNKSMQFQTLAVEKQENQTTVHILNKNEFSIERSIIVPFNYYDLVSLTTPYGDECLLTQNMFNNDDKWEYVVWEEETDTQTVYNEDGECLGIIPEGYEVETLIINGTAACFMGYYQQNHYYSMFQFNNNDSGIKSLSLKEKSDVKAYPNPVRQENQFTVEFSSPLTREGKLKIYDTSGKIMYRKNVMAGESSVNVPVVRLRPGLYFYVIEKGGQILASDKLIVE